MGIIYVRKSAEGHAPFSGTLRDHDAFAYSSSLPSGLNC